MENGDFELAGYLMGRGQPVFVSDFQPGSIGERNQDEEHPQDDVRLFGRDFLDPPIWSFELNLSNRAGSAPAAGVLSELEQVQRVWRTAVDSRRPEEVVALRYQVAGRVRRVYGRPRNFAYNPSKNLDDGLVTATAQFALRDTYTYADELTSVSLTLRQPSTGFTTLPGVWPLQMTVASDRQGSINVASSAEVLVEDITFYGPIVNPSLTLDNDWTVAYTGSIPYDGWVTIDPRRRTVKDQSGNSRAGLLSRKTYLPSLTLPPGERGLLFTGQDLTATSRAVVRWRPAYFGL